MDAPAWTRVEDVVRTALAGNDASHDWAHVQRVLATARTLARMEGVTDATELRTIELGALLHDISDYKYSGSLTSGAEAADRVLQDVGVNADVRAAVVAIVDGVGFSKEITHSVVAGAGAVPPPCRGVAIVQDADRLDALGAIGIARCFTFGGARGRPLHDPSVRVRTPAELSAGYVATATAPPACAPSLNHFDEKLLTLRDRMKTPSGRTLAGPRHDFMVAFVAAFKAEWDGLA